VSRVPAQKSGKLQYSKVEQEPTRIISQNVDHHQSIVSSDPDYLYVSEVLADSRFSGIQRLHKRLLASDFINTVEEVLAKVAVSDAGVTVEAVDNTIPPHDQVPSITLAAKVSPAESGKTSKLAMTPDDVKLSVVKDAVAQTNTQLVMAPGDVKLSVVNDAVAQSNTLSVTAQGATLVAKTLNPQVAPSSAASTRKTSGGGKRSKRTGGAAEAAGVITSQVLVNGGDASMKATNNLDLLQSGATSYSKLHLGGGSANMHAGNTAMIAGTQVDLFTSHVPPSTWSQASSLPSIRMYLSRKLTLSIPNMSRGLTQ
jgi:hypothetical protein